MEVQALPKEPWMARGVPAQRSLGTIVLPGYKAVQ